MSGPIQDYAEKQYQAMQQGQAARMQREAPNAGAPSETVKQMLILISEQTGQLIERTFTIGNILVGSPPPPPTAGAVAPDASNVLDQLRQISQGLALAVSHCERAQKAL